jgi:hypothetical protein
MNIALNPEATADKSRETYRKTYDQFEVVTLDTAFPQTARELAETSVAPQFSGRAPTEADALRCLAEFKVQPTS